MEILDKFVQNFPTDFNQSIAVLRAATGCQDYTTKEFIAGLCFAAISNYGIHHAGAIGQMLQAVSEAIPEQFEVDVA